MLVYNKKTNSYEEEYEGQENLLNFLYNTFIGRILLKLIFARPWFSKLRASYYKSPTSYKEIHPFIEKYHIDVTGYKIHEWNTFNDFFIRKRKIINHSNINDLNAIADSKLSAYKIDKDLVLNIKRSKYSLEDIVGGNNLEEFKNGYALVFRLSTFDYHRYCFLDDGEVIDCYKINGELHTVRPVSKKYKVYSRNTRIVNKLNTDHFGDVIQVEVGAMLVGCIQNNNKKSFKKLEEKGYFEYGGSTIILLMKNNVKIDEKIVELTTKGIETKVKIGEKIGERIC